MAQRRRPEGGEQKAARGGPRAGRGWGAGESRGLRGLLSKCLSTSPGTAGLGRLGDGLLVTRPPLSWKDQSRGVLLPSPWGPNILVPAKPWLPTGFFQK